MKLNQCISIEELKAIFNYEPSTGNFTWKKLFHKKNIGSIAGCKTDKGYVKIVIEGKSYRAHRLVWILYNGAIPDYMQIDHINGIRDDNRIENLRLATPTLNSTNRHKATCRNKLGMLGVHKTSSGKFKAQIQIHRKNKSLGTFDSPEDAHNAYLEAKRNLHEGCTI